MHRQPTPEATPQQAFLPAHESIFPGMLPGSALEVLALMIAHASERRGRMKSKVCPKSIDWDWI